MRGSIRKRKENTINQVPKRGSEGGVAIAQSWSSLVVGDEGCIGPSRKLLCTCQTPNNYAAHAWHHSIQV